MHPQIQLSWILLNKINLIARIKNPIIRKNIENIAFYFSNVIIANV